MRVGLHTGRNNAGKQIFIWFVIFQNSEYCYHFPKKKREKKLKVCDGLYSVRSPLKGKWSHNPFIFCPYDRRCFCQHGRFSALAIKIHNLSFTRSGTVGWEIRANMPSLFLLMYWLLPCDVMRCVVRVCVATLHTVRRSFCGDCRYHRDPHPNLLRCADGHGWQQLGCENADTLEYRTGEKTL